MATIAYLYDTYEDASQVVTKLEAAGIPHSDISLLANNADSRIPAGADTVGGGSLGPAGTGGLGTTGMGVAGSGDLGLAGAGGLGTAGMGVAGSGDLGSAGAGGLGMAPGMTGTTAAGYGDEPLAPAGETTGSGAGASIGTILGGGAGLLAGIGALAIPGVGPVVAAGWLIATLTGAGVGAAAGGLVGSLTGSGVSEEDAHVYAEGVRRGGTMVTVRASDARADEVRTIMTKDGHVNLVERGAEYRTAGWDRFDESSPTYTGTGSRPL